jgi:type II secretion system protein L
LIQVVPELFLCPWQGEGIALTEGYDGCLLRYGNFSGLKCQAQALPAMLALVKRNLDTNQITYYANGDDPAPELEGYEVERQSLNATQPGLISAPLIDLQQRDFQLSSAWIGLAKAWKWIALLFAALLVFGAYNKAIALHQLEGELGDIRQQQFELLKPHLSAASSADSNLKKLLIDHLKRLQMSQREQGFLKLLLEFTRARTAYPGVIISRVAYQAGRLSFDINSNQLTDIEALTETVRKQGLNVKLESLSIKPEQSSGRLVLTGADDV